MFADMLDRAASALGSGQIPLWVKILYTLYLCVIVPVYLTKYGPSNFLWFSDIALLTTAVALWIESPLLASMMALAVALPELLWNLGLSRGWSLGSTSAG